MESIYTFYEIQVNSKSALVNEKKKTVTMTFLVLEYQYETKRI